MTTEPRAQRFDKHRVAVTTRLSRQRIVDGKLALPLRIFPLCAATEMQHMRLASAPHRPQPRSLFEEVNVLHVKLHVVQRIELNATLQTREGDIENELVAPLHLAMPVAPGNRLRHCAYRTVERTQCRLVTGKQPIVHDERIRLFFRRDAELLQVSLSAAVDRSDREARPCPHRDTGNALHRPRAQSSTSRPYSSDSGLHETGNAPQSLCTLRSRVRTSRFH